MPLNKRNKPNLHSPKIMDVDVDIHLWLLYRGKEKIHNKIELIVY